MKFANPNMNRIITQGILVVVLFFSIWFALSSIDWMSIFNVEENRTKTEEKLGNLYWDLFSQSEREIESEFV